MMDETKKLEKLVYKAHQEEIKAGNEMNSDELKVTVQREQLDTCLDYRDECLSGLKSAKTSGLSIVQLRECQLLVKHLDTVAEDLQYKADLCEEKHEKTKKIWEKKRDHFNKLTEQLKSMTNGDSYLDQVEGADVDEIAERHPQVANRKDKFSGETYYLNSKNKFADE